MQIANNNENEGSRQKIYTSPGNSISGLTSFQSERKKRVSATCDQLLPPDKVGEIPAPSEKPKNIIILIERAGPILDRVVIKTI